MRRLILPLAALLGCLFLAPRVGPAATMAAGAQRPGSEWPAMSSNNQWLMIETEPILDRPGGSAQVLEICRRAKTYGYNGLVLWDSNVWERDLPPGYLENAEAIKRGLHELGFTLMVEVCPRGMANARWNGDLTMVEPRPIDPHPEEKDYRYLCLAHPGVQQVWEEQLKRAEEIYHPMGWLLQYDEIRVAGTDERCRASGKSPGQLLRDHVQKAVAMVRRATPGRTVAVWSDMFDPYFNATSRKYYHVVGSLAAAAGSVDRDVLIFSWNDKAQSFPYWANRGNKQIVPLFFDHDDLTAKQEADLLRAARRYARSFVGWVYSTWKRNYSEVEAYGARFGPGQGRAVRSEGRLLPGMPFLREGV